VLVRHVSLLGEPLALERCALERDGALYEVTELGRCFGQPLVAQASFHELAVGLGADALTRLDERLASGDRPTTARLGEGTFTLLPPLEPSRALVALVSEERPEGELVSPRVVLEHGCRVVVPRARGGRPLSRAHLAALLAEPVDRATAAEAERALLGVTLALAFGPRGGPTLRVQLGPSLLVREPQSPLEREPSEGAALTLEVQGRAHAHRSVELGLRTRLTAAVARVSERTPLEPGDLVAVALGEPLDVEPGEHLRVTLARMPRLEGELALAAPSEPRG
jgi:hypothetical protein